MCIMFRDEWIILFFKFPFCGNFSLLLHKMVQETSRNTTQAENLQRRVVYINTSDISCLLNGRKHRIVVTRSCKNLMIKAQQETDTNKSKPHETSSWATLVCSTQSPNLVINSSCFPQLSWSLRSSRMGCPGEGLNLCAKFSEFLFLSASSLVSIRNLDLQSRVCCIKQKEIFTEYLKEKPVF